MGVTPTDGRLVGLNLFLGGEGGGAAGKIILELLGSPWALAEKAWKRQGLPLGTPKVAPMSSEKRLHHFGARVFLKWSLPFPQEGPWGPKW